MWLLVGVMIFSLPVIDMIKKFGAGNDAFERWLFSLGLKQMLMWQLILKFAMFAILFGCFSAFVWKR